MIRATGTIADDASDNVDHHRRPDDIRELNKTGVAQMRQGDLDASLATLQLALSLTTTITATTAGLQSTAQAALMGDGVMVPAASINSDDLLTNAMKLVRATTLCNLGCIFRRMGKLAEAVHHLQLARDLECKTAGSRGRASITTMLNLCTVLLAMGRVDEALASAYQCTERAEEDSREADGSSAPNGGYLHALALHNLAVAQQSSDNREERRHASTTMLKALDVARTALGDAHPTTVMLRVKCGVPNVPHAQQQSSTTASTTTGGGTLVPQAPAGSKPKQPFLPSVGRRNEAEAARQALRHMSPMTTTSGNDAIAAITRGGQDNNPVGSHTNASRLEAAAAPQESFVMAGAAFSDAAPPGSDPQEGGKVVTGDAACVDLAARLQATEQGGAVAEADGAPSAVAPNNSGDGARAAEDEDVVVVSTPTVSDGALPSAVPPATRGATHASTMHDAGSNLRVVPSSYQSHQGSGTASPSPSYARPSSKASSSAAGNAAGGYTLVLQRTGSSLDRPPAFMRFAPYATAPPPAPTTFTEIREELRAEREQRRQAAAMQERADGKRQGSGATNDARNTGSEAQRMVAAVADRKKKRAMQEEAEERLLRERLHAEEQQARIEEARRQRAQGIQDELEHQAARRIQRCYRAWWHRVGFARAMQRKKAGHNNNVNNVLNRKIAQQQRGTTSGKTALSGSSTNSQQHTLYLSQQDAGTRLSRVVLRCARKWHKRSFGRLLLLRLSAGKAEGLQRIELLTRRIQRCWRMQLARRRARSLRALRTAIDNAVADMETRARAARRIQATVRVYQARRLKAERKQKHYWRHVVAIQRWFRSLRAAQLHAGQHAHRVYYRSQAAVVIQRVWRGYTGRLRAVMVRLKRKLAVMRQGEHARSIAIQRVSRGFQVRRTIAIAQSAAQRNQAAKAAAMIAALASKPLAVAAQPSLVAYRAYVDRAPQRAPAVDRLAEQERESHHVPLVLDTQAARHQASYTHINALDVRRQRAAEELMREQELRTLVRHRAARLIQRTFRRWVRLVTPGGEAHRIIAARTYERSVIQQRATTRAQALERNRLRSTVLDLGEDARGLVEEGKREIAELTPSVASFVVPPAAVRPPEMRADHIKQVKEAERQLACQVAVDSASLRAVPTFMTQRQRRQLVERREQHQVQALVLTEKAGEPEQLAGTPNGA